MRAIRRSRAKHPRDGSDCLARALESFPPSDFPPGWQAKLEILDAALEKWAPRLSLTGFDDRRARARRYFLEALAAASYVPHAGAGLDVGSGAGSPALPLATARPGVSWVLVESRRRKAGFLLEAVREMGLTNVTVDVRRFDRRAPAGAYDVVTTRGVAMKDGLLEAVRAQVAEGGAHLAFSSERLLRTEAARMRENHAWRLDGPHALLGEHSGVGGWLLVCRRLGLSHTKTGARA